uniref:Uncharacterized protein n=1 Tax=Rhizophora mucronata TaxID=61149 RepID=A0A2P2MAP1_RHIMU
MKPLLTILHNIFYATGIEQKVILGCGIGSQVTIIGVTGIFWGLMPSTYSLGFILRFTCLPDFFLMKPIYIYKWLQSNSVVHVQLGSLIILDYEIMGKQLESRPRESAWVYIWR